MKIAVQLADPDVVKAVRSVADNPSDAAHPIYDVSRSLGTGKATCRACNQPIKENERTLLFRFAPHESDHEHHYRRVRMVIHEDDCSRSSSAKSDDKMINCPLPSCKVSIPQNQWSQHWQNHEVGSGWIMRTPAASVQVCAKHSLAHCGQCEEDRELEEPKLDERVPTIKKNKITADSKWRHTEEDGFEMWETTEDPNEFAIIENNEKFDLYYLKGSYSSVEEAKEVAKSMTKIAQDGGGGGDGGGSSGGSGGGDGASGASSGASSGDSGSDAGVSTSGEAADSSDNESSESSIMNQDNTEDPRPPSDKVKDCPKCKEPLQETQLLNNIRGFICNSCGYTYKKRKPKKSLTSWMNNLVEVNSLKSSGEDATEPTIEPRIPPSLLSNSENKSETKPAIDLFGLSRAAYRTVTCQRCGKTYRANKKGHFTGFCETCKENLGIVNHRWDSQDSQRGHAG